MAPKSSDDPHFPKSFSCPLSKRDILAQVIEIGRKLGLGNNLSELLVNYITELVQKYREQNMNTPININYNYITNNIFTNVTNNNNSNQKPKTLDDMLTEITKLIDHMADTQNNNLKASDYSRIQQYGKQLAENAGKL